VTIFDISAEWQRLITLLDEIGSDPIPPDLEADLTAWFDQLTADDAAKLEDYCRAVRTLETEAAVARAEAEQYERKAAQRTARVAYLKGLMRGHLEATGRKRATTSTGRVIAICANGGKVPLDVDPVPYADLPPQFQKVSVTLNNDAVRAALDDGEVLEFARYGQRGSHLRIS